MEKFNYGGNKGALYDKTFYTFDALVLAAQLTTLHVVEFMDIRMFHRTTICKGDNYTG